MPFTEYIVQTSSLKGSLLAGIPYLGPAIKNLKKIIHKEGK